MGLHSSGGKLSIISVGRSLPEFHSKCPQGHKSAEARLRKIVRSCLVCKTCTVGRAQ